MNIRLNSRGSVSVPELLGVGAEHLREVLDRGQRHDVAVPVQLVGVLGPQVEELERPLLESPRLLVRLGQRRDEDRLALGLDPAAADLVVAIAFLRSRGSRP